MKNIYKIFIGILSLAIVAFGFWFFPHNLSDSDMIVEDLNNQDQGVSEVITIPDDILEHISSKGDLVVVDMPSALTVVSSPLMVSGRARGGWYFEGSFPLFLTDWDGKIIASSYASATLDPNDPESTWMTEDFVPFTGTIEFSNPSWDDDFSKYGILIFQKDNPSGLPEYDDALEIPIFFN